jgi:DNA-binding transcriptional LysR family regulator
VRLLPREMRRHGSSSLHRLRLFDSRELCPVHGWREYAGRIDNWQRHVCDVRYRFVYCFAKDSMPDNFPPNPWFVRSRLKPRQLQLIIALGRECNIHRAAESLDMAQPAASKLLKDLEDALQVELFQRLPRGMRVTTYGEVLIRYAEVVLGALHDAGEELSALRSGSAGQVSIGAITAPTVSLLPRVVADVKKAHPALTLSVTVDSSDILLGGLARGTFDLVLARLAPATGLASLQYERLADEHVCVIARRDHPLARRRALSLQQVASCAWIIPPAGGVLRQRFDLAFKAAEIARPVDIIESSAYPFVTHLLQQSDRLAVTSVDVARYFAGYGLVSILSLKLKWAMDSFGLITRKDRVISPAAAVVLAAVRAQALRLYGGET